MKYLKTIIFEFTVLIILTLLNTIFYYFNLLNSSSNNIFKIVCFILIFISAGILTGKNSDKKGWFEGLKISAINIILFFIISLISKYNLNLKQLLYYILMSITTVLGSIIGINFKRKK